MLTKQVPASFSNHKLKAYVEIDGVNYGSFEELRELDRSAGQVTDQILRDKTFKTMRLTRDFVTEPSLYFWAKKTLENRLGLKDLHLVMEDANGNEISRYVLRSCHPLTWMVEASNPAVGGFHETVDLAVQDIALY